MIKDLEAFKCLVPGAYEKLSILKKLYVYLDWYCAREANRYIITRIKNKKSPSGLQWSLYENPWYFTLVSRLEYQLRYLVHTKPDCIGGFFPFYYRKNK